MDQLIIALQQFWQGMNLAEQMSAVGGVWLAATVLCYTSITTAKTLYRSGCGIIESFRYNARRRREESEAAIVRKVLDALGEPRKQG